MSETRILITRCDKCGRDTRDTQHGWFAVYARGIDVQTDFCSLTCLRAAVDDGTIQQWLP